MKITKRLLVKLTSSKFIVTAWSCFLISWIVIAKVVEFNNVALALCAIPLSYFVTNAIQHKQS